MITSSMTVDVSYDNNTTMRTNTEEICAPLTSGYQWQWWRECWNSEEFAHLRTTPWGKIQPSLASLANCSSQALHCSSGLLQQIANGIWGIVCMQSSRFATRLNTWYIATTSQYRRNASNCMSQMPCNASKIHCNTFKDWRCASKLMQW